MNNSIVLSDLTQLIAPKNRNKDISEKINCDTSDNGILITDTFLAALTESHIVIKKRDPENDLFILRQNREDFICQVTENTRLDFSTLRKRCI